MTDGIELAAQLDQLKADHAAGTVTDKQARERFVEITGQLTVEELAAATGTDLNEAMNNARQVHAIANDQLLLVIERAIDLGQPGHVGLLALYQIARMQVVVNLRAGSLSPRDVKASRVAMELLSDKKMHRRKIGPDGVGPLEPYNPEEHTDGKPTP